MNWRNELRGNDKWVVERYKLGNELDQSVELTSDAASYTDLHGSMGHFKYVISTQVTGDSTVTYSDSSSYIGIRERWIEASNMRGWKSLKSPVYNASCSYMNFNPENTTKKIFRSGSEYVLFTFNSAGIGVFHKASNDQEWNYDGALNGIKSGKLIQVSDEEILLFGGRNIIPKQAYTPISESRNYLYNISTKNWTQIENISLPDDENIYLSNDHSASEMEDGKIVISSYGYHNYTSEKYDRNFNRNVISVYDPATKTFNTSQLERSKIFYKTAYLGNGKLMGFTGRGFFINGSGGCDPCLGFRTPYDEVSIYEMEENKVIHTELSQAFNVYNYNPVISAVAFDNYSKVIIIFQGGKTIVYDLLQNDINTEVGNISEDFTGITKFADGRIIGVVSGWFSDNPLGTLYEFDKEIYQWNFVEETPFKEQPLQILGSKNNELIIHFMDSDNNNLSRFYFFSKQF